MALGECVLGDIYKDLQTQETNIGRKVYNWLGEDWVKEIIIYNGNWWYNISSYKSMPKYVFTWLKRYMKRKYRVKYLYETVDDLIYKRYKMRQY